MTHNAFARDLAEVINRHSVENVSNTSDIVLGEFLAECLDAFDAAVNQRTELAAKPVEQPQDAEVQQARAFLAELSENIRSYHQSIPGQPGCTCGRSLACGNDVPDYAAIWTLEAALDAWKPAEEAEQPQDAQPERDGDDDVRAVAAYLAASHEDAPPADPHPRTALERHFADRIAELDARDAKTPQQPERGGEE